VRYDYFRNDPARGDGLLRSGVPLVCGVGVGGPGQDHHIAIVPAADGVWAVDPWPGPPEEAVRKLPQRFTLTRAHVMDLALKQVRIPCGVPILGYYRDADYESRHVPSVGSGAPARP
jgi:hypothetical protein